MNGMNFLDLVKARYSVRSYRPQAVEREKVEYLLECARLAPSAVNFQPWRFFVVASDARREALRRCYHREWFAEAPLCIAVCVDESVSWKAIAAEHICLAAAEQGLGSCWVCNFDVPLCREALELPATLRPVVLIPVGYPADAPTQKKRKSPDEVAEWR